MHIETRVGEYSGDIGELTRQYSQDFFHLPVGRPDVHKYVLKIRSAAESYFLMVSNCDEYSDEYNMIITIFGPNEERAKHVLEEFGQKLGVPTRPAPDYLREQNENIMRALHCALLEIWGSNVN